MALVFKKKDGAELIGYMLSQDVLTGKSVWTIQRSMSGQCVNSGIRELNQGPLIRDLLSGTFEE